MQKRISVLKRQMSRVWKFLSMGTLEKIEVWNPVRHPSIPVVQM